MRPFGCRWSLRVRHGFWATAGREDLALFWKWFQQVFPNHDVSEDLRQGVVDASSLVPVQLHGDGGRHFKKTEVMILQWQPVLGGGTKKALPSRVGLAINYCGNTCKTRFLFSVPPRAMYSGTPQPLNRLFRAFGILFACVLWFVAIVLIMLISLKL